MRSLLFSLLILTTACGSPPMTNDDAGAGDAGQQLTDAGTLVDAGSLNTDAGLGPTEVRVEHNGNTHLIDLSTQQTASIDSTTVVLLSTIISAAEPTLDLSNTHVSFLSYDGFNPATRPNCMTLVPVSGSTLMQGGLTPDNRNLQWADSLLYPMCLYARGVVKLTVTSP